MLRFLCAICAFFYVAIVASAAANAASAPQKVLGTITVQIGRASCRERV
jgi:hypothetical protein